MSTIIGLKGLYFYDLNFLEKLNYLNNIEAEPELGR